MPETPSRFENLRNLRLANTDMAFYTVFVTLAGGPFLIGFVQSLCAEAGVTPDPWIGAVTAIPSLLGLLQVVGAVWGRRYASYKRFVAPGWLFWRLFYIPIAVLPFVGLYAGLKLWVLGTCLVLSWGVVFMANPVFFDWLAELVPAKSRGWFFSRRNALAAGVGAVVGMAGGAFIDFFKRSGPSIAGVKPSDAAYGIVFGIAVLLALVGQAFFSRMQDLERRHVVRESLAESLGGYVLVVRDRNFAGVLAFLIVFVFAQTFAGNFFTAYAFESLRMPVLALTTLGLMQAIGNVVSAPIWGFLADKYGNRPMLAISGFGMVLTPLPWVFCVPNRPTLNLAILVPAHLIAGVIWAGIAICQFNLLLATAKEEDRSNCLGVGLAVSAFVGGIAPILGAAFLHGYRPPAGSSAFAVAHAYKVLFIATAGFRLFSVLFLAGVKEAGSVRVRHALRDIGRTTPRGLKALRDLRRATPSGREHAIQSAASENLSIAENEIMLALHDPSPRVRREAASALGRMSPTEAAVDALLHQLQDHPDLVEEETVEALGRLGDPRAVPTLTKLLGDYRHATAYAAAKALGRIGSPEAGPELIKAAAEADGPGIRSAAIKALVALKDRAAEPAVVVALLDPQPIVRIAAAEAVAELQFIDSAQAVRESLERYSDEAACEVAYALGAVGSPADAEQIARCAAASTSIITRRRCLLGIARLFEVERQVYSLFLQEEMVRDHAVHERLKELPGSESAFEAYSAGDNASALNRLAASFAEPVCDALAFAPSAEAFIVAACVLAQAVADRK